MPLSQLDLLPVELIHEIFSYLSAHEIFYAFSNLTNYLDAILISYDRYLLNFRSVLKPYFDITCHSIRPERIISLTLSDDNEIPCQSKLFFSFFNIEQFIHLRSFDMSSMSDGTFKKLLGLHTLKYLSSLELPHFFQPDCKDFEVVIRKILPQLRRLMIYNTRYLLEESLPNLHHLALKYCNCYHLSTILKLVPNLRSLDIILTFDIRSDWPNSAPVLTRLRKLVLSTYGEKLTMGQLKEFLPKMPNLRHFELDTEGSMDLIDGQQWELLVSRLSTFDFRICILDQLVNCVNEKILQSFRSLFWLEQKRWFVAFDDSDKQNLFTIPRFVSNIVIYPYIHWPPLCTSSDFCFDQYIKCLRISLLNPVPHRFINITSLVIETDEISTDIGFAAFINLIEHMSSLHSVTLRNLSILNDMPNNVVFDKIRNLNVQNINTRTNIRIPVDINRLYTVFPRLERLNMELISVDNLFLLIDQLRYLSIANFEFSNVASFDQLLFRSSSTARNWLIMKSRRLKDNPNFMCKIIAQNIHLWISNEKVSNNNQLFKWYWPQLCVLQ